MTTAARLDFDAATHTYRLDGRVLRSVTQILEAVGIIDYSHIPPQTREMALERGRLVHLVTQIDDEGELDEASVDPMLAPYLEAWRAARREFGLTPIEIERRVCDARYGYAGTLDRVMECGDRKGRVLVDLKTNSAEDWVRLQTAAYAGAEPTLKAFRRLCVELRKDGTYRPIWMPAASFATDYNEFLAALTVYRLQPQRQRREAA